MKVARLTIPSWSTVDRRHAYVDIKVCHSDRSQLICSKRSANHVLISCSRVFSSNAQIVADRVTSNF